MPTSGGLEPARVDALFGGKGLPPYQDGVGGIILLPNNTEG